MSAFMFDFRLNRFRILLRSGVRVNEPAPRQDCGDKVGVVLYYWRADCRYP
jgi:hypothetical protein